MLTTARSNDQARGPQCLLCFLPSNIKGVQIQDNWDTMSIRSSCSNDVVWNNVFIEEKAADSALKAHPLTLAPKPDESSAHRAC